MFRFYLPRKGKAVPTSPTMKDKPLVEKCPLFINLPNTSFASRCWPKKMSGRMIAKKPSTCSTRTKLSILGSSLPRTAFTKNAKQTAVQSSRTVCHGLGSYEGWVNSISPWTSVPDMYETDATLACQPQTVSQPVKDQRPQGMTEIP